MRLLGAALSAIDFGERPGGNALTPFRIGELGDVESLWRGVQQMAPHLTSMSVSPPLRLPVPSVTY